MESSVAVKILMDKSKAFDEISKLLMVGHPNVMGVLDIVETSDYVGIIMPLMHMDLRVFMHRVVYDISIMVHIKIQTMKAVYHIHTREIVHLDIKPENICVDFDSSQHQCINSSDIRCRLVAFGSSLAIKELHGRRDLHDPQSITNVVRCFTIQTTRGYQPPKLTANGSISFAGDIYSIGVVFSELINNSHGNNTSTFSLVMQPDTSTLRQLSLDMQSPEFRRRPSSRDVLI
jgi:serine/threonine protein kinase